MKITHFLSCLICAAVLAGCAAAPEPIKPAPTLASLMQQAELAIKNGQQQQGLALFHSAAVSFPRDKAPWMRMAQIQFECHNYGDTISSAQQVLERDPDDLLAHSLVAVSGLRVSSKALTDLTIKNNLTGSVRAEAQDLAKLLRASIGGDIILPVNRTRSPAGDLTKKGE